MNIENRALLGAGIFLLLIGLLTGFLITQVENPRMGLSAHLAAIQGALLLMALSANWKSFKFEKRFKAAVGLSVIIGIYLFWLALLLAAIWGTSKATPIAGAGFAGAKWQETIVMVTLTVASIGLLAGSIALLAGLGKSINIRTRINRM